MDLTRVVAVANGKGGVGKTSLVANLAGEFARAGSKVLVVDLDVSGNLKLDLGAVGHSGDDAGKGVYEAITQGVPLKVVENIRERIDWLPGGAGLNWLIPLAYMQMPLPQESVAKTWRASLAALIEVGGYDMVLVDCPPGSRELQQMALAAARWVVVPMRSDAASWEGLQMLGPLVREARTDNPDIEWLGMVLFGHSTSATRVRQTVLDNLVSEDSSISLFNTSIRASESTAQACRLKGLLVNELVAGGGDVSERLRALRARRTDPTVPIPETVSKTSSSLAEDYADLATEIATQILEREGAR